MDGGMNEWMRMLCLMNSLSLDPVIYRRFQATEAKMLRVSVSTFYDYLKVALKCIHEFEQME